MLAKVAAVSQFPGFARWAYADQSTPDAAAPAHVKPQTYTPRFFSPAQYKTVDRLTDLIIPADDTPGAHEAGVAEFIDFMAASDPQLHEPFQTGLAWLDAAAQSAHSAAFLQLPEARQIALLQSAATAAGNTPGRKFFVLIRDHTVMGFYTSKIGLEALDYPGLKMYSHSPECPHHGNPEHKNLPGAGA